MKTCSMFLLVLALLAVFGPACGDDGNLLLTGLRCGDGICSSTESPESCTLDCSHACVPGTGRCEGNILVTCQDDGLHQLAMACQPGQYCTEAGCVEIPDAGGGE